MILKYQLQFFAKDGPGGEKTEPATQKKLTDARKEGKVAKSREIANGLSLLALFILLKLYSGVMGNTLGSYFINIYNQIPDLSKTVGGDVPVRNLDLMLSMGLLRVILVAAPIFLAGFLVSFLSDFVQVKWSPSAKTLEPKFDKLNPISGFKNLFSSNSLMELFKAFLKIGVIAFVSYRYLQNYGKNFYILLDMSLTQAIALVGNIVINLGIIIAIVYMIVAVVDFIYQKVKFSNDMKMTKQEVKDEMKDQEGSPDVKGKQRQRMQEASRRRMMQRLPEADVVITNPTHFAIAILYDSETYDAPIVLAKGADHLAQRIKEIARENSVEIVENKPLARMLYANVEIGEQVPPELYQAVAEVLAYVYHLKGKA